MSRLPFLLLALVATALSAAILLQLDAPEGEGSGLPEAAPRREAAPTAARPPGEPDPAARSSDWAATVLARPLFDPDRRPPAPGAATRPADAALPRLAGTMVTAAGRRAIFAGGGAPLVVQEGARVGAFTVVLIAPGEVTLMGPGGVRAVRPSFDPARPAAPQPSAAQPGMATSPGPASPALVAPPPVAGRPPADPLTGRLSIGSSPEADAASEGPVPFEQRTTPSGLDILRNTNRSASPPEPGAAR